MNYKLIAYKVGLWGFVCQAVVFLSLFFQAYFLPDRTLLFIIGQQEALIELLMTLLFLPFEIYFLFSWGLGVE